MLSCFSNMANKKRKMTSSSWNTSCGNKHSKVAKSVEGWIIEALRREEKLTKFFFTNILLRSSKVVVLLEGKLLTYKKTFNSPISKMNIHLLAQVWTKIIVQFDFEFFQEIITTTPTAQKMKFSIKDFFSKCD